MYSEQYYKPKHYICLCVNIASLVVLSGGKCIVTIFTEIKH